MSESIGPESELQHLIEGVVEELESSSPEQQAAFRREFMLTLAKGFLLFIGPDPDTKEFDTERAAVRIRTRGLLDQFRAEHPDATALETLRAGHRFSVESYRIGAEADVKLEHESIMAQNIEHMVHSAPEVDEEFAQEALDYIERA